MDLALQVVCMQLSSVGGQRSLPQSASVFRLVRVWLRWLGQWINSDCFGKSFFFVHSVVLHQEAVCCHFPQLPQNITFYLPHFSVSIFHMVKFCSLSHAVLVFEFMIKSVCHPITLALCMGR